MTTYTAQALASFPWIVSSGTLRAVDLADAYLGAVDTIADLLDLPRFPQPAGISNGDAQILQSLATRCTDAVADDATDEQWEALARVEEWLGSRAPEGCYFGGTPGDGACMGFWLTEEAEEMLGGTNICGRAEAALYLQRLADEA